MTLIASLLFAIALAASIGVIVLTLSNSMPRIYGSGRDGVRTCDATRTPDHLWRN